MEKDWKIIFYEDEDGCPMNDFINLLSDKNKKKMIRWINYLKTVGVDLRRPQGDYLRDGIYELRISLSNNNTRTLYFFCYETDIVLTHTFIKTTKEVPESEIQRAIKYKEKYLQQHKR